MDCDANVNRLNNGSEMVRENRENYAKKIKTRR
jgi:hypothetical protein